MLNHPSACLSAVGILRHAWVSDFCRPPPLSACDTEPVGPTWCAITPERSTSVSWLHRVGPFGPNKDGSIAVAGSPGGCRQQLVAVRRSALPVHDLCTVRVPQVLRWPSLSQQERPSLEVIDCVGDFGQWPRLEEAVGSSVSGVRSVSPRFRRSRPLLPHRAHSAHRVRFAPKVRP